MTVWTSRRGTTAPGGLRVSLPDTNKDGVRGDASARKARRGIPDYNSRRAAHAVAFQDGRAHRQTGDVVRYWTANTGRRQKRTTTPSVRLN
ncbi:hypothetical protein chiPu_0021812 [Chiloscyllium punctatum]|uniref:Uncharacterized protein n=1 Tax=Chiloscyllium punctatum TaxID=137246 RepID=A0A401RMH4_CHIPU|nr:hypothetical protein [Chiloscyllium punctatum]